MNLMYIDGSPNKKVKSENIVDELENQVRTKILNMKNNSEKIILRS